MEEKNLSLIKKYFNLLMKEYMVYITYDCNLEPESKAIRKKTVQSLRALIKSIDSWWDRWNVLNVKR